MLKRSEEVGPDSPCDVANNGGYRNLIQLGPAGSSYEVPEDGIIISWSVAAPQTPPGTYAGVTSMTVQFQVWRPMPGLGEFFYRLVFISEPQKP